MTNPTPERSDQVGAFFTATADRLQRAVHRSVRAPEPVIEDACQIAWTILLRRPDITLDARGHNWLTTIAIREAWRLASTTNEIPSGGLHGGAMGHDDELPEPSHPDDRSAEQRALARIEHQERIDAFKTLKPREREALYFLGLGHSYAEIGKLTNSSQTAVNRRISEGRAALRQGGRKPSDRREAQPARVEATGSSATTTRPSTSMTASSPTAAPRS